MPSHALDSQKDPTNLGAARRALRDLTYHEMMVLAEEAARTAQNLSPQALANAISAYAEGVQ